MSAKIQSETSPTPPPPPPPPRAAYPLREASQMLGGISLATIYRLAAKGKINITKIGGRSFLSAAEIARLAA